MTIKFKYHGKMCALDTGALCFSAQLDCLVERTGPIKVQGAWVHDKWGIQVHDERELGIDALKTKFKKKKNHKNEKIEISFHPY